MNCVSSLKTTIFNQLDDSNLSVLFRITMTVKEKQENYFEFKNVWNQYFATFAGIILLCKKIILNFGPKRADNFCIFHLVDLIMLTHGAAAVNIPLKNTYILGTF